MMMMVMVVMMMMMIITITTIIIIIICYLTGNNWSHLNSNRFNQKFGSCTKKTFDRFITKDSCTWNITHITESTAVRSLKVSGGDHRWFKRSTGEKIPVTGGNVLLLLLPPPPLLLLLLLLLIIIIIIAF